MYRFVNAQAAFEFMYDLISMSGTVNKDTKFISNAGFYIVNPADNLINTPWRKFKESYAETEWLWYVSGNRNVSEIKKVAKMWDSMHTGDNIVNSNYGYQWKRNNQLDYVINELTKNKDSRRAAITIYDGKEHKKYSKDTPCTLNIIFSIIENRLNMSVLMRSNDLWFGFCNDQYCFSKLQQLVADKLNLPIGWYYHFANNLHVYNKHLNRKN